MKKLNRVAGKGDAAPRRAQSKKLGTNTALIVENEIACWETGYAEEQRIYRTSDGYVLTTEFTEVLDDGAWIRAHEWRLKKDRSLTPLELGQFEPFQLLPRERLRVRKTSRKVTREQALRWLHENIIGNAIPREFQEDFRLRSPNSLRKLNAAYVRLNQDIRRLERRKKRQPKNAQLRRPVAIDYRSLLCILLGLDAKANGENILCAMAVEIAGWHN